MDLRHVIKQTEHRRWWPGAGEGETELFNEDTSHLDENVSEPCGGDGW